MKPVLGAVRARQLFAIHRWTGLLTGIVILFLSLTGSGLVFITEIDRVLNRKLLTSKGTGQLIPPERALESIERVLPKARVGTLHLPRDENGVYLAATNRVRDGASSYNEIGVHPYTGEVLGKRDHQSTFAFVLRQLHLRFFYFGWKGRVVVGVFGLLLLLSTITGLLIYSRFIRALPKWYSIRRTRGFQISTSDWHKLIGILSLVFNIVIAFTGAILGLENLARYSPAVSQAIHPKAPKSEVPKPPESLDNIISVSAAIAAARSAMGPAFEPTMVYMPTTKRHYTVFGNITGRIAMEGANEVSIDATTGKPYFVSDARTAPAITKSYYWMDPLHFGYWGGAISQILYVIFGLTTGFLSVTGFIVWYAKKNRRPRAMPIEMRAAA